jgi:voltage-gated potassium channel
MRSPWDRVRRGFFLFGAVFLGSVCAYRLLGYPWIEAVWMVVITIASVGYGERSQQPAAVQLVTVIVILVGFTAAAYTFGGLLQLLLAGELEQILGRRRMTNEINALSQHAIVVGFGRIGRTLSADLDRRKRSFVVIERDLDRCRAADERGYLYVHGNATEDEVLMSAGLARARSLISALPNDADNVFITLTARNLSRGLFIVARAEHATSERKLRQAGADRVVMPSTIGAQQMSRMITRPNTADLMELVAEQGNLDVELDELHLPEGSSLVGRSVRDSEAHHRFGLLVLAVKRASGEMTVNPQADFQFQAGDIIIVLGKPSDMARLRDEFRL